MSSTNCLACSVARAWPLPPWVAVPAGPRVSQVGGVMREDGQDGRNDLGSSGKIKVDAGVW